MEGKPSSVVLIVDSQIVHLRLTQASTRGRIYNQVATSHMRGSLHDILHLAARSPPLVIFDLSECTVMFETWKVTKESQSDVSFQWRLTHCQTCSVSLVAGNSGICLGKDLPPLINQQTVPVYFETPPLLSSASFFFLSASSSA